MSPEDRFWVKVDASGVCWEWTAARLRSGYGIFNTLPRTVLAHRWSWTTLIGEIPQGLTVDHLCRVRWCVCPDHLELVTRGVNTLRGYSGPAVNARKTHCIRGHSLDDAFVFERDGQDRRHCRTCDRERKLRKRAAR